ncbi:Hypothetical protein NTJ_09796 [Nesidiocoris tenuis]|uniref:Uncharacterized protein n=1 Tax=Nesidiocoris tenuis TaxID=355587 RepID=A0ABN7AYD9_9HEMI|nr:Hypothetical protein NTJ_09796 [Nesidiocoris tenuis]
MESGPGDRGWSPVGNDDEEASMNKKETERKNYEERAEQRSLSFISTLAPGQSRPSGNDLNSTGTQTRQPRPFSSL